MAGVDNNNVSTPVSPVDSEPADAGPSGTVTPNAQQVAHPRVVWISLLHLDALCRKPRTNFQEGTRNFSLQADTSPSNIWDVWIGLCVCLHVIICL